MQITRIIFSFFFFLVAGSAYATLPIQHWQTSSGAKVYFVHAPGLPILDVSVNFPAGSSFDNTEKSGVAHLTQDLLKLGSTSLSEDQIAEGLASVGAILNDHFDRDRAGLTLRTLSSQPERNQAIGIFAQILQSPTFEAAILEREKTNLMSEIKQAQTRPDQIAERAFFSALYGTHHYALPPEGTLETIPSLTSTDLRDFYATHYSANLAIVAIVSDLSKDEVMAIADALTEGLPKSSVTQELSDPMPPASGTLKTISHPATQSHILMGTLGLKRGDPDYFPLYVGNHILGGSGFGSRLVEDVREKQGLVYSVYSYFIPYKQNGPFLIGLQTQKEQTQRALETVNSTLGKFFATGPTQKELVDAKKNIVGGFPLRFDSNKELLEYLTVIGFYQLPLSYLDDFIKNVERVSLSDIRSAFKRRINQQNFITVVVGGPG